MLIVSARNFDINKTTQLSQNALVALDAKDSLQAMLAAQILSIHELQQKSMTYAHAADDLELKKYFTNATIKLANSFVQQANTLAKLQGVGGQKIIVNELMFIREAKLSLAIFKAVWGLRVKNENDLLH